MYPANGITVAVPIGIVIDNQRFVDSFIRWFVDSLTPHLISTSIREL